MQIKSQIGIEYMRVLNTDSLRQIIDWLYSARAELEGRTTAERPLFKKEELAAMENDLAIINETISHLIAINRASKR